MSAEQAPRLSLGRRIAMGGGFLFLAAAGLTDTGLAIGESLHNTGVAASAEFKGNEHTAKATYHERTLDNYGALGGLVVAAGSTAAAAVSMRGVDFMRINGQWYHHAYPAVPVTPVQHAHTA